MFRKYSKLFIESFLNEGINDTDFSLRFKTIFTLFVGETLSILKEGFNQDINTALLFCKINLEKIIVEPIKK